MQGWVS
ncbi:hypothetical protein VCHC44C1_3362A, partial [Vibrio cholerae HC-44C1]